MDLEQTLREATQKLNSEFVQNEAQVKHSVILPILRALGWDDADPRFFRPELSVPSGSVDYALFNGSKKPVVFVEAKNQGKLAASGEKQLFRYANNKGVPLLVLSDGDTWDFYLSMAEGEPEDRRFLSIRLSQSDSLSRHVNDLQEFLNKDRVISTESRKSAEDRLSSIKNREIAKHTIPSVWSRLLRGPDDLLVDLLMEQVKEGCAIEPHQDDVREFLKEQSTEKREQSNNHITKLPQKYEKIKPMSASKIVAFTLDGIKYETGSAIATLYQVLQELANRDPEFMKNFAQHTKTRTRNLVSQDRTKLYSKPHLTEKSKNLGNGWWLGSNIGTDQVVEAIVKACKIGGLKYDSDLKLH